MSIERDIDDILDSLNQLLREGESHNDDHVDENVSIEEIEAELQELVDEPSEPEMESSEPAETIDEPAAEVEVVLEAEPEQKVEAEAEAEIVADAEVESEPDSEGDWHQDEAVGSDTLNADDSSDDYLVDASEEEGDEDNPADERVTMQRVVLTEDMLVNNPQRSLLSIVPGAHPPSDQQSSDETELDDPEAAEIDEAEAKQHTLLHVNHDHLESIMEKVADDVIEKLQRELPNMIKHSLYHHLAEMRDAEQTETDKNSEE